MKKIFLVLAISCIVISWSKNMHTETHATVLPVKYACGIGCNAFPFAIKPVGDSSCPVRSNLPELYKVDNMPVIVDFARTGDHPEQFKGPDAGVIYINSISQH